MKALIVTRLSKQVEESTSAERQRKECEELCKSQGWEVIGVAEDLNVSAGKTSPFQRPELKKWLGDGANNPGRMHEIDVIVFWRLDRITRSVTQMADLIRWTEKFDVVMKSATEQHFDLTTSMGKVIASLVSSFAEMELSAISERITADQQHRMREGKYRGSRTPLGYTSTIAEDGSKILVQDEDQVSLIRWIIEQLHGGLSANAIAHELNNEGVLSPLDLDRESKGKEPLGGKWSGQHIRRALSSPTLLGQIEVADIIVDKNGKPVLKNGKKQYGERRVLRDEQGMPIQRAEPILTREEFKKLQDLFASRSQGKRQNKASSSLLTGVIFCGCCGAPAYKVVGGKGRKDRYRCRTKQYQVGECSASVATVDFDWINSLVEEMILDELAGSVKREKVWNPGNQVAEEIEELEFQINDLVALLGQEPYTGGSVAFDALQARIKDLSRRLEELKKQEPTAAGWEWEDTDESFADWWHSLDTKGKNQYLKDSGFKVEYVNPENRTRGMNPNLNFHFDLEKMNGDFTQSPQQVRAIRRLEAELAGELDPYIDELPEEIQRIKREEHARRQRSAEQE